MQLTSEHQIEETNISRIEGRSKIKSLKLGRDFNALISVIELYIK